MYGQVNNKFVCKFCVKIFLNPVRVTVNSTYSFDIYTQIILTKTVKCYASTFVNVGPSG